MGLRESNALKSAAEFERFPDPSTSDAYDRIANWNLSFCKGVGERPEGGPPALKIQFSYLPGPHGRIFRLLHPFRHLRFQRVQVEARASLHRGEIEEGLDFLGHHLLDEQRRLRCRDGLRWTGRR
jgi:hypothetical protein